MLAGSFSVFPGQLSQSLTSPFFFSPLQAQGLSQLGVSCGGQANLLDTPGYYPVYHYLYVRKGPNPYPLAVLQS